MLIITAIQHQCGIKVPSNVVVYARLFWNWSHIQRYWYCCKFWNIWYVQPKYTISKKHFRPGGMAVSEWTRSVRAIRDTPVADYSAPGVNTTRHIACRSPIAVSQYLFALSVSDFKHTLWHFGQLWPYVGMGSLGTRLHRDYNAMNSTSVGTSWEDMILPGPEDRRNLGKSKCDQKLGKIQCVFSLYDKMRWKWDAVYLPLGLPKK